MQIIFDYISVRAASTNRHRLSLKVDVRGRAYNDCFSAKFVVNRSPNRGLSMQFVDAEIVSTLENEWRLELATAVKVLVKSEIKRLIGNDIPNQMASLAREV